MPSVNSFHKTAGASSDENGEDRAYRRPITSFGLVSKLLEIIHTCAAHSVGASVVGEGWADRGIALAKVPERERSAWLRNYHLVERCEQTRRIAL